MSYPAILPSHAAETESASSRAFQAAVSSVVLRSLAVAVLISAVI